MQGGGRSGGRTIRVHANGTEIHAESRFEVLTQRWRQDIARTGQKLANLFCMRPALRMLELAENPRAPPPRSPHRTAQHASP